MTCEGHCVAVSRTGGSSRQVSVSYDSVVNTAVANVDFASVSNVLTWADGDVSDKSIPVPILDNNILNETYSRRFDIVISNPTGDAEIKVTRAKTMVYILDDGDAASADPTPPRIVQDFGTLIPTLESEIAAMGATRIAEINSAYETWHNAQSFTSAKIQATYYD